ncbi:MAG: hypothetical protein M3388_17585 [Acidobacteriota bacterium]|nr:hypothetical protein [Acidobacteriota bacterium]
MKFMLHLSRSILLLICLTVLFASFVRTQSKVDSAICNNQLIYPNADLDNFETPIRGNVKQILEQETDLTNGVQSDLVETQNYNQQGSTNDSFLTNAKIKVFGKTIYTYDEKNRLVRKVTYNPDGSAVLEDVLSYDSTGNLKQVLTRNAKSKVVIWKKDFSYDVKKIFSEFVDSLHNYGFRFVKDKRCRMTELISFKSDKTVTSKTLISYNDNQNTVEQTVYSPKGEIVGKKKSEFEFDAKGNWIKETKYELAEVDGKLVYQPVKTINRKITYFDTK